MGTVSVGDFLWHIVDREQCSREHQETELIHTVMREDFNPAVKVSVSAEELLERALQQNFVPVVDDREFFIGIVTRQSIMKNLATKKEK